jgi:ankyrin repeat protein
MGNACKKIGGLGPLVWEEIDPAQTVVNLKLKFMYRLCFFRSVECLDFLIASGASINVVDEHGRLPLHYAASKAWYDCIFTLVSGGSDVNRQDVDGRTPLMLACAQDQDQDGKTVEYLIKHKADASIVDNKVLKKLAESNATLRSSVSCNFFVKNAQKKISKKNFRNFFV